MIKNRIQVKAVICFALALAVTISISSAVSATVISNELLVIDSENTCPEGEHIHEEDFVNSIADMPMIVSGGDVHCSKGSQVGHLLTSVITTQYGYSNQACIHGREGSNDYCYQYMKITKSNCSMCSYSNISTSTYWGNRICN